MKPYLKPISDQVMVITGASSGIGLVTARRAAEQGARLVLAARNQEALEAVAADIHQRGGQAIHAMADVGDERDMHKVAECAIEQFGGFDTWVNNAGISIYGGVEEVPIADQRQLFDTNYWGVVYGSRVAAKHLRRRGGVIINIGSVLSDRAIPLQGAYSASKHAVKAFTDALRMELEADGAPVSVTLIKPSAIDTPYEQHARNYLDRAPKNPPPVYAPELVADAILHAAGHRVRDLTVGGGGRLIAAFGGLAPRLSDWVMARVITRLQHSRDPVESQPRDALYVPADDGRERGGRHGSHVMRHSPYTTAQKHPLSVAMLAAGLVGIVALLRRQRRLPRLQAR
jgi:NAD(P)-dependent dehydrogenase (short-subunit alcohol dehydrogenase family)